MCLVVTISAAYEVKNVVMRITAPYAFKAVTRYFFLGLEHMKVMLPKQLMALNMQNKKH